MFNYKPSLTGQRFLESQSFIKLIMGPVGGGKSTVALMDLLERAVSQKPWNNVRRTKYLIVRNTLQQLKSTVKPLIDQWLNQDAAKLGTWRLTDATYEIKARLSDGTILHTELIMLPADTPDDVRRLLSVEVSGAWVEECREIDPEVFNNLGPRTMRFPSVAMGGVTYPGVIGSTNPPPLGGFWHETMSNPPDTTEVFIQPAAILDDGGLNPAAENIENLHPEYYENLMQGKTEAWVDVYLKNKYGPGDMGQPVFKGSFRREFHVSPEPLRAISQTTHPLIVGMDNGLQAAAVIGQQDARSRINILGEAFVPKDQTMGVESFLDKLLIPKLRAEFPVRPEHVIFVLDPACFQRSQINEETIAQAVMRRGYRVVRASTNDPERRVSAVEGLLVRQIDGKAGLMFDPRCTHIIQALDWGYRHKKSKTSEEVGQFDKNHWSHIADALQYFCLHYNVEIMGSVYNRNVAARPVVKRAYAYV